MMEGDKIKLSIPALAAEIFDKCNPRLTPCKVHIHYFGSGTSVSVTTTGVPTDHKTELVMDINDLNNAMNFVKSLVETQENKLHRNILQRYELDEEGRVRRIPEEQIKK